MHQYPQMIKNNLIFSLLAVVILGIIIGVAFGRHQGSNEIAIQLRENEILRKEIAKKEVEVMEVRRGLAQERTLFELRIRESHTRYDSLVAVSRSRQAKLLQEIKRLKNSTVKELENEADSIYRNHTDKH